MPLQEQTPLHLLSWEGLWSIPDLTHVIWGRRFVHPEHRALGLLQRVMDVSVVGETEAEAADKVCLELCHQPRVKSGNSASPQLLPAPSCLEELVPTGSLSWGKKAEAGGFLALP